MLFQSKTKDEIAQIKSELILQLATSTIEITFMKLDGTYRTMNCTLNPAITKTDGTASKRKQPDHLLAVFDVDKNAWRSIVLSQVIQIA